MSGHGLSVRRSILAGMTRFEDQDLTDAEFRECDLTRARLIGVVMQDAIIDGLVSNLVVNGVEVSSYVEAELDRRHPVRLLIRSADPVELLQGFRSCGPHGPRRSNGSEGCPMVPNIGASAASGRRWRPCATWCLCTTAGSVAAAWDRPGRSPPSGWPPITCSTRGAGPGPGSPRASTRCWPCATCRAPSWTVGYRP